MTSAVQITNVRSAATIELGVDQLSLQMQDNGARESASASFDMPDFGNAFSMLPEDEITISEVGALTTPLFGGFVRTLSNTVAGTGRGYRVTCYDYSTLLDRSNVVQDDRAAGETDKARLTYLMTTYGTAVGLSSSATQLATLNGSMLAQKFRLLSLRQAIESVLGAALVTGNYAVDASKRLVTWDNVAGLATAPYNLIIGTPAGGQIAPADLTIDGDSSELYNAYFVRGSTAAGSGWFVDAASVASWGRREKYIDAPESDLAWKASNIGLAALADTAQPKYHGSFSTQSPKDGWRARQRVLVTSTQHNLSAAPFDIQKVTTTYLSGTGLRDYAVQFGSPPMLFTAKHGKEIRRSGGTGIGGGGGWVIGSGYYPGGAPGVQSSLCGPPWNGIGTPDPGTDVLNEFAWTGNGTTTAGVTAYHYLAGTLRVWVAGMNVAGHWTEDNPATGAYHLNFAPTTGQRVTVNYTAA